MSHAGNVVTGPSGQTQRLASGGLIDRGTKRLPFRFDTERDLAGLLHGDTLASALLANGVRLVGRSFKVPPPRGIQSAGSESRTRWWSARGRRVGASRTHRQR